MLHSTTRSGIEYKRVVLDERRIEGTKELGKEAKRHGVEEMDHIGDERGIETVVAVVQMFKEERRMRQMERDEERRKCEQELRLRDEENARREEYNTRQIEILQSLVQGIQLQGEAVAKRAEGQKDVKVQKLTEEDDIVAYIATFERLMIAYEVKHDRWVFKLASSLVGKAQQAYASLNAEDASDYDRVKKAILQRYDITE